MEGGSPDHLRRRGWLSASCLFTHTYICYVLTGVGFFLRYYIIYYLNTHTYALCLYEPPVSNRYDGGQCNICQVLCAAEHLIFLLSKYQSVLITAQCKQSTVDLNMLSIMIFLICNKQTLLTFLAQLALMAKRLPFSRKSFVPKKLKRQYFYLFKL